MTLAPFADVRFQFSAGENWASSSRNPKQKKPLHQEPRGPTLSNGSLRLKCIGTSTVSFKIRIIIGNLSEGPFECHFADTSVQDFPLGVDWRQHLEPRTGCLRIRVQTFTD